jgi:hypothetical protein
MGVKNDKDIVFYVGEKPKPTAFEIRKADGSLDTAFNSATFVAWVKNENNNESSFACTNNGDGTGSIDWPTDTSVFISGGTIRVDMQAAEGSYITWLPRMVFPVLERS